MIILFYLLSIFLNLFAINWIDPSFNDFKELEKKLSESKSPLLYWMERRNSGEIFHPPRKANYLDFKFMLDQQSDITPHIISFGENKERIAICSFSSLNYTRKKKTAYVYVKERIKQLRNVKFNGDFIYQIGGYPNIEEGDLKLYETPYAFKIAMLRYVKNLGYKKVLWLDNILEIKRPLNGIFHSLNKHPVYLKNTQWKFQDFCPPHIVTAMDITEEEYQVITHYDTGILGFNFENPSASQLLDQWYELAANKELFFSSFPEQIPLAVLLFRNKIHIPYRNWKYYFRLKYHSS